MKNLIIGKTSQLSHYFPDDYERISSRNIDFDYYKNKKYNRVFMCFSEQRTFLEDEKKIFNDINVDYTIDLITFFRKISNKVVVYGTSELWNNYKGAINSSLPFDYVYSPYIESKKTMVNIIRNIGMKDVIILHPFNFNSIYRKRGFLFWKIMDSLINNKKIEIGNTYFYRDLIHPKYIAQASINADEEMIVGSGRLIFVNDFIRDLYSGMDMNYDEYVIENFKYNLKVERNINYSDKFICGYKKLLDNTLHEIKKLKKDTVS